MGRLEAKLQKLRNKYFKMAYMFCEKRQIEGVGYLLKKAICPIENVLTQELFSFKR